MKDDVVKCMLHRLKRQVDSAVALVDAGALMDMTESESEQYRHQFGDFDLVIGNFGIRYLCYSETIK